MTFYRTLLLFAAVFLAHSQMTGYPPMYQTSYLSPQLPTTYGNNTCRLISVSGTGLANAAPDTALISIGVSAQANTSVIALSQMNTKARQLLTILSQYNVPIANIQTSSLTLGPDYTYINNTQILLGQRAQQSFSVKINNIGNGSVVGSIVDSATNIVNITVSGLTFDINNKTALFGVASKNAWSNAVDKATQQASLSGVQLGKANRIDIQGQPSVTRVSYGQLVGAQAQGTPTQVSVGNYGVTSSINVDFIMM